MKFSVVVIKSGSWFSAFVPEIPGVNSQGKTVSSAKKNLMDAMKEYFHANRKIAFKEISKNEIVEEESLLLNA